jgi:hypothetical protein
METIQRMTPDAPLLAVLAQQGVEVVNLVVAKKLTDVARREPSAGDNDWARRFRSEVVSSASPNHRPFEHDAWQHITQNCAAREYGCD